VSELIAFYHHASLSEIPEHVCRNAPSQFRRSGLSGLDWVRSDSCSPDKARISSRAEHTTTPDKSNYCTGSGPNDRKHVVISYV